ncbi:MAG: hypothetical protein SVU32_08475 [Candidatus Nanohaloarchaea archaeon]|nr:hypothetical protein [Candidatus Nanohaloarchaea archaeon]
MAQDDFYRDAAQRLVEKYSDVIGDVAPTIASRQDGVEMDGDTVESFEGGSDELDALVDAYEDVIGAVAVQLAKQVLGSREKPEGVELPARLEA